MQRLFTLLCLVLPLAVAGQSNEAYFIQYPSLTPDGSTIIFSHDSDLWSVPAAGGMATRLTAMEGQETYPMVSPDGKWIAFSSNQYGNTDVYRMPIDGGPVVQLTFHQGSDRVSSWSWDSQNIYFSSNRENRTASFAIAADGGTPTRVFDHYFNNDHHLMPHPDGQRFFFNESWESDNFANRKGYKGAFNPDLKSYSPATGTFRTYTDWEGKDYKATIDQDGTVYFLSDEYNGEYNLYQLTDQGKKRLTNFTTAAFSPNVSADGSCIVFRRDYQLWTYDVASKKARPVSVQLTQNSTLAKDQDFKAGGNVTAFDVAPDGKKMAFVSRGELFASDIGGKFIRHLATNPRERVKEVYWLSDSETLVYSQTVGGYTNWFSQPAHGNGTEKALTDDDQNNRLLSFNSDRSQAVYLSGREEVRLMDMESMESETLFREELWGFYNDWPRFAHDDRHILITAYRDFERDLMWYDLETETMTNLTKTGVTEAAPFLSPDGKYIYFSSNPTQASYPFGLDDPNIYRMQLQAFDDPYRSDKYDALFAEAEEKEAKKDSTEAEEAPEPIAIDMDGLMDRIERVGPSFGSQNSPWIWQKEDETVMVFASNHDEGQTKLWKTTFKPFERPKTEAIKGANTGNTDIITAKNKQYLLVRGDIHTLDIGGGSTKKIELDHTFRRNLNNEFRQMYYETWANLEENFYNGDFHGVDWDAMRDRYATYLPYLNERNDLRRLLNDLLGELNTSHFGFSTFGREENIYYGSRTLATGIQFSKDNPYEVERLIAKTPAKLASHPIEPGDVLTAVNGRPVIDSQNREAYFVQPSSDEELALTFRRGDSTFVAKIHPTSYTSERSARYDEWMEANQSYIDEKSGERIAYVHMRNMGGGELDHFLRQMVSKERNRDGIILDLRWNTGGNVHDRVLEFLSRRPYLQWKYRGGELTNQPNFTPATKPIVLLINEQSLSDAEMTSAGFKELGLGTIIGTETYRWIIFTSGNGLVDGSFYRLPSWGCYTLDGDNLERTGVSPDITVGETFEDRLEGQQPQLDRAISEIMKQLKN